MHGGGPSDLEKQVLPFLLNDPPTNVVVRSDESNTKPAAVINFLSRVDPDNPRTQVLSLLSSRELARNFTLIVEKIGGHVPGLTIDLYYNPQERRRIDAHVLVTTPGLAKVMLETRQLDLSGLKVLTIHRMEHMISIGSDEFCRHLRL
jgi:ATP-dependent RNA helicase DDX19/DBP5